MKKIFVAVFLFLCKTCLAQDPFFSQYNSNAIYLNPAFAGSFEKGIFTAAYRNQWPGFDRAYQTLNLSFNKYYSKINGGIGINYFYDCAGNSTINTHAIQIMYVPHFQLKNSLVIKPGVSIGYIYKTLDFDKLTFGNMIDPRYGFAYPTQANPPSHHVSCFDVSTGVLVYNKIFSAGVAVNHLNTPDESFIESGSSPLPIRYTVHGSLNFSLHSEDTIISIQPSAVYVKQGKFDFYKLGCSLKYSWLITGIYYQPNYENVSLMVGFEKNRIRISYSYDFGNLDGLNVEAHEFFISYSLPNKKQKTEGMLFNNSFAF